MIGQTKVASLSIGRRIHCLGTSQRAFERAMSDGMVDKILEMGLSRYDHTSTHTLDNPEDFPEEVRLAREQHREEVKDIGKTFKRLVTLSPCDFSAGKHLCIAAVCFPEEALPTYHTNATWTVDFATVWGRSLKKLLPSGSKVAANKYFSWSRHLAFNTHGIFIAEIVPEAWLENCPLPDMEKKYKVALENDDRDKSEESAYQRDKSAKLVTVSRIWAGDAITQFKLTVCNPILVPSERLLLYFDRCDALANRHRSAGSKTDFKSVALILQITTTKASANPIDICLQEVTALFEECSNVGYVLHLWSGRWGRNPAYCMQARFIAARCIMHHLAQMLLDFIWKLLEFPYPLWTVCADQVFYGLHSVQALKAATSCYDFLRAQPCDIDEFLTQPVLDLSPGPMALLDSTESECMRESSPDIVHCNFDMERFLSDVRRMNYSDQTYTLSSIASNTVMNTTRLQHERRGLTNTAGQITSAEIQAYSFDFLARKPKRPSRGRVSALSTYYSSKVVPEWKRCKTAAASNNNGNTITKVRSRRSGKAQLVRRVGERWVKGCSNWLTWTEFWYTKLREFNNSQWIKDIYQAKADQENERRAAAAWERVQGAAHRPPPPPTGRRLQVDPSQTYLGVGSLEYAVRPELVEAVAHEHSAPVPEGHPTARRECGPVTIGRSLRDQDGGKLLITDPYGPGEDPPSLDSGLPSCQETSPGMCKAIHAAVYESVQDITCNLNTIHAGANLSQWTGRIYEFKVVFETTPVDGFTPPMVRKESHFVLLAHFRLAQPAVQVFVPCTLCTFQEAPGAAAVRYRFQIPVDRRKAAVTSYAFARQIMWKHHQENTRPRNMFLFERFAAPIDSNLLIWEGVRLQRLACNRSFRSWTFILKKLVWNCGLT